MKRIVGLLLVGSWSALAQTNQTVIPLGFENKFGNAYDPVIYSGTVDYQEIIRGSSLTPVWGTPVMITEMAFRPGDGSGSLNTVVPRIEIRLTTSARAPEQMSLYWSGNRGPDESVVYLHDNVSLFAAVNQPNAFDIRFHFDQPFRYDPSQGNLAFDFKTTGVFRGCTIDAESYAIGLGASPFASITQNFSGTYVPYSLVTEFSWTAVPEPSTVALTLVGVGIVIFLKFPRRCNGQPHDSDPAADAISGSEVRRI